MNTSPDQVPDFDDLPTVTAPNGQPMPQGCAWGVFDKNGKKDVLGTLNFLTPEIVRRAYTEARDGISISLNWDQAAFAKPTGGLRIATEHTPIDLTQSMGTGYGWDEQLTFNTQSSSQWDSLVHWQHQATRLAYNGVSVDADQLKQGFGKNDTDQKIPTLQHWHSRGGLVARGVLLDIERWSTKHGRKFGAAGGDEITIEDLELCAQDQGVEFHPGDVLVVRTGFTELMEGVSAEQQQQNMGGVTGLTSSIETARWIWNKRFSAVASDVIALEKVSFLENGKPGPLVLHEYLLSLFGMSIGELWDLKLLSQHCASTQRYSFLLTSAPLNVGGLVGSPPNALALF